jgi:D-alanyl-D-alanine dipeptidase
MKKSLLSFRIFLISQYALVLALCLVACQQNPAPQPENKVEPAPAADTTSEETTAAPALPDSVSPEKEDPTVVPPAPNPESRPAGKDVSTPKSKPATSSGGAAAPSSGETPGFADVVALESSIRLDIRYATTNNFTKAKIYDCPRCLLRPAAAAAIVRAHEALRKQGYGGLKMFDCYRPRPYQQRLWDKVPNPDYVTPPAKGSMHSRGAAVDLTIVDRNGQELDMGTPYDFFGREAHFDYTRLSPKVLANRRLLRSTLEAVGFEGIRTEWWHFSYRGQNFPLSDFVWKCR